MNKFIRTRKYQFSLISVLLSTVLALSASCGKGDSNASRKMDLADSLMESRPDSYSTINNNIDKQILTSKKKDRYALLKTIALDKNMIDTATIETLQPAIDHYLENGTTDEMARTYFYQGRILQNQGREDLAMKSLLDAKALNGATRESLTYARLLVALGSLYYDQYKTREFVDCNLEAAFIYGCIGKSKNEIICYAKALSGVLILADKTKADSIYNICSTLVKDYPEGQIFLTAPFLSHVIEYGSDIEIKTMIDSLIDNGVSDQLKTDIAYGYAKIGEGKKALDLIDNTGIACSIQDSLKWMSAKTYILESLGEYKMALKQYKDYHQSLEKFNNQLLNGQLLLSEREHEMEMEKLMELREKDKYVLTCGIIALVMLVIAVIAIYQYRLGKEKSEKAELEANNLRNELDRIAMERDSLAELVDKSNNLSTQLNDVVLKRLELLNGLLASEISSNKAYALPYQKLIKSIHDDRKGFMDSTRLAFKASNPVFIVQLEERGLSEEEVNYVCLYALGLRGKEIGEYIQMKRHYNMSSAIRKKLGMGDHDTNLGIYIRRLLNGNV